MVDISNLAKINNMPLNDWFIPTMFNAIELDNTFILWSNLENEYFIDTVNNLLKIKLFYRVQRSFKLNVKISDGNVVLFRNSKGDYFPDKEQPMGFRLPISGDSLEMNGVTYLINSVSGRDNIILDIANKANFISTYNPNIMFIDGTNTEPLYNGENSMYYSKHYRSNNVADIYIDGEDIRSVAGKYW